MYRKNFGHSGRSGGKPSFRRGFRAHGNRGGHGRARFTESRLDISKLVKKAVITEEAEVFIPEHSFADFKVEEILKTAVIAKGYVKPMPIQDRAIPHILRGDDVVGIANTGTGKTATFLIPLINKILLKHEEKVLIIVPTRELAIQINEELKSFTRNLKIFSVCCVGGAPIGRQISDLRYQNSFVIGTPGRLKDLMERKSLDLSKFKSVVLDEADRMLDMGFIHDMKFMLAKMPTERHTLLFSATLSKEIENLIKDFCKNPVRISVKTQETAKNVDQDVVRVGVGNNKIDVLAKLLAQADFNKVLIFCRTKHGVDRLMTHLLNKGFRVDSIHGDKQHSRRQKALKLFKESHVKILVATDVAARGLDIDGVTHVINYDMPASYEDYVHRIGRTGRGSSKGKALTFIE